MTVHPYYPLGLVIPNWLPQSVAMEKILFRFFVTLSVLFVGFALVYRRRPASKTSFSNAPFFLAAWFFLCGIIHTFVEGYFVATHGTIAGDDTFLANLWKEYGKSDSRYMISDPTVLIIEAITAVRVFVTRSVKPLVSLRCGRSCGALYRSTRPMPA